MHRIFWDIMPSLMEIVELFLQYQATEICNEYLTSPASDGNSTAIGEAGKQSVRNLSDLSYVVHPLQAAIRDGFVRVNEGVPSKPGLALRPGDVVACRLPPLPSLEASPEVHLSATSPILHSSWRLTMQHATRDVGLAMHCPCINVLSQSPLHALSGLLPGLHE